MSEPIPTLAAGYMLGFGSFHIHVHALQTIPILQMLSLWLLGLMQALVQYFSMKSHAVVKKNLFWTALPGLLVYMVVTTAWMLVSDVKVSHNDFVFVTRSFCL